MAAIMATGSIVLARYLGAELLGLHAVVTFLLGMLEPVLDFGVHASVIRRRRDELGGDFLQAAFTLKLALAVLLVFVVLLTVAPLAASWYQAPGLYWLLALAFAARALASPFRVSLSLLEKDMDYARVTAVELLATVAFFLPASLLAVAGYGLSALVVGEVARGLATLAAFPLRPFKPRLSRDSREIAEMVRFGSGHLSSVLVWMLNTGVNPLVVAKLAGLEAAGQVRIAEGLMLQASFLKGIGDRISYPLLADLQASPGRVAEFVKRWRLYQFMFGALPLLMLAAASPVVVPLLYGPSWRLVAPVLLVLAVGSSLGTVFGVYTAALVTAGRAWRVTQFHAAYGALLWLSAVPLVLWSGAVGYAVAFLFAVPSYAVIHRSFVGVFGPIEYRKALVLVGASCAMASLAWTLGSWWSVPVFLAGQAAILAVQPEARSATRYLATLVRGR